MIKTNAEDLRVQVAPLYHQYPGQASPQLAFIELDCESHSAEAKWTGEIGNAVPAYVWHKRALRFTVPSEVRGDAIADFLESETFQTLAQRICDGYKEVWNGNNYVGRYSDDATEAQEAMQTAIEETLEVEGACARVVDPAEWWQAEYAYNEDETEVVFTLRDSVIRITSETTDKELSDIARELETFTDEGIEYEPEMYEWLDSLRDNLFSPETT